MLAMFSLLISIPEGSSKFRVEISLKIKETETVNEDLLWLYRFRRSPKGCSAAGLPR